MCVCVCVCVCVLLWLLFTEMAGLIVCMVQDRTDKDRQTSLRLNAGRQRDTETDRTKENQPRDREESPLREKTDETETEKPS